MATAPSSLASLLRYLHGVSVTVELKSGRSHSGVLQSTDSDLNLVLRTQRYPTLHLRGSSIRYVRFPDDLDILETIHQGMDRRNAAFQRHKRSVRTTTSA